MIVAGIIICILRVIIGILTIVLLVNILKKTPPYDEYKDYDWNEDEEHEFYEE